MGNGAGGQAGEGFTDVVASFPADPQPTKAVQPGDRPLDHIPEDAQAAAVLLASFGNDRADTRGPERTPTVVAVAPVCHRRVRPVSGATDGAVTARALSSSGSNCVTSLRFPPVTDTASGCSTYFHCPSNVRPRRRTPARLTLIHPRERLEHIAANSSSPPDFRCHTPVNDTAPRPDTPPTNEPDQALPLAHQALNGREGC